MIFNGDLIKYHPADAIMFLSQLNLNGIFSVVENQRLITLSFNNGFIIDAHSAKADAKILQGLMFNRRVTNDQVKRIHQIRQETGMPIRSILTQIDLRTCKKEGRKDFSFRPVEVDCSLPHRVIPWRRSPHAYASVSLGFVEPVRIVECFGCYGSHFVIICLF